MKTLKTIIVVLLLSGILMACEKEGPAGPAGSQGVAGAKGDKGDPGNTGPRGAAGATGPKGDKGATGAKGAIGPKGATGATGAQGPKGDQGDPGTANVIYSEWEAIQFGGGISSKVMNIGISEIDASVLAHGSILVYIWSPSISWTSPLPYTHIVNSQPNTLLTYRCANNLLQLVAYRVDPNSTIYNFPGSIWKYRYIIIPGGIPSSAAMKNVNLKDYNAVAKAMNIPD